MGYLEGLSSIKEELSKQGDFPERQKATWLTIKDKESVKLTPLQELDNGSPAFSVKNGLGRVVLEHQHPTEFKRKAECTINDGSCYGCEQGWRQKKVLYLNVLVDNGMDEPFVAIFSRALGKNSVAQVFVDVASDEDFDFSISNKVFKYSRTGSTKDNTTYTLSPLPKPAEVNVEDYDLWDLDQAPFQVEPEKQEVYYTTGSLKSDGQKAEAVAASAAPATAASVDVDW